MVAPRPRALVAVLAAVLAVAAPPGTSPVQTNWAGVSNYYLWSCNETVRAEALDAVRAAGLRVLRVFLLSTRGEGAVAACDEQGGVPDLEPEVVGQYNDAILSRLDDLLFEASSRGIKLTVALHDRWSLGCWRSDAYQRKYGIPKADCKTNSTGNDPTRFYRDARDDFKRRITHILAYRSRHTGNALGQWSRAIFSIEAQNEAFGHAAIPDDAADWMCDMARFLRTANASGDATGRLLHPSILVTTGGGGVGLAVPGSDAELRAANQLAGCAYHDVLALHSYQDASTIDRQIQGYLGAIAASGTARQRLILQEWGTVGPNSTDKARQFSETAAVARKHRVPQMAWALQPSHSPQPSTSLGISPPSPSPSPGRQRERGADGQWQNYCDAESCPTEVWVTALYPAAQAAALQVSADSWPEIWGCGGDSDCGYNGHCREGACECKPAWRGPTCTALRLLPAPRGGGLRIPGNVSSWGGSVVAWPSSNNTQGASSGYGTTYHMFASVITERCGLAAWYVNSEVVRATSPSPLGPYRVREVVAHRFAHEPNIVFGTGSDRVMLLATMYPDPPNASDFRNCTGTGPGTKGDTRGLAQGTTGLPPSKNTYVWSATSPEELSTAPRALAIDALQWDHDKLPDRDAICDTNAAAAMVPGSGEGRLVGLWRHCETDHLHTVPHSFTASANASVPLPTWMFRPNISSANVPYMSHAGAEDPMVWYEMHDRSDSGRRGSGASHDLTLVYHAILHDEQITRCADAPVGCWPGGRHAYSTDGGATWEYSPFDAYNGTVEFIEDDGTRTVLDAYLRARPHMVFDGNGTLVALSNGLRPQKASEYVYTLVQPVATS